VVPAEPLELAELEAQQDQLEFKVLVVLELRGSVVHLERLELLD
jgi:hypothetical protein